MFNYNFTLTKEQFKTFPGQLKLNCKGLVVSQILRTTDILLLYYKDYIFYEKSNIIFSGLFTIPAENFNFFIANNC